MSSRQTARRRQSDPNVQLPAEMDRRKALKRLGLGVGIAYVAPTVLHLDRSGNAAVSPSCRGASKGNPWCQTSGKGGKGGK